MEDCMTRHTVILSPADWTWAEQVGRARDTESKARGYQGRNGQSNDRSLINHIEGAAAELAVCKSLGISWAAHINTYQAVPDVEVPWHRALEVKWSAGDGLIIRESSVREDDHVLVTGKGAIKRIVGWLPEWRVAMTRQQPKHQFDNGRADAWLVAGDELEEWGTYPREVSR
jgi:hypothetical protein